MFTLDFLSPPLQNTLSVNCGQVSRVNSAGDKMVAKERKKYGTYNVPWEKFVTTWEESNSVDEVAIKLGMPREIVASRKSYYTGMGMQLKSMPRKGKKKMDVDKANELIAKVREKMGLPPPEESRPRTKSRIHTAEERVEGLIARVARQLMG